MTRMDAYVTPTDDTDYNCHIKAIELIKVAVKQLRAPHNMRPYYKLRNSNVF